MLQKLEAEHWVLEYFLNSKYSKQIGYVGIHLTFIGKSTFPHVMAILFLLPSISGTTRALSSSFMPLPPFAVIG